MDDIDTFHRRDGIDVLQPFGGFHHAHYQRSLVERSDSIARRYGAKIEHRVTARDRALADRRELGATHRALRLVGGVDVGEHDAHDAVVQQHLRIRIVATAHARHRHHAAAQRCLRYVPGSLDRVQRMLAVDKNEIVASRLRNARDVSGTRDPRDHAQRNLVRLEKFFYCILDQCRASHVISPSKLFEAALKKVWNHR